MQPEHEKVFMWGIGKLLSARFLALVALTATFCAVVSMTVSSYMAYFKVASTVDVPPGLKEISLLILTAFISTINTVIAFYFLRSDRGQTITKTGA